MRKLVIIPTCNETENMPAIAGKIFRRPNLSKCSSSATVRPTGGPQASGSFVERCESVSKPSCGVFCETFCGEQKLPFRKFSRHDSI